MSKQLTLAPIVYYLTRQQSNSIVLRHRLSIITLHAKQFKNTNLELDEHVFITFFSASIPFQIYLSQFGYLNPKARNPSNGGNLLSQESWENAIREFQGFAGLNITGTSSIHSLNHSLLLLLLLVHFHQK